MFFPTSVMPEPAEGPDTASFSRSAVERVQLAEVKYAKRQSRLTKFNLLMWKNWTIKATLPTFTVLAFLLFFCFASSLCID